MQNMGKININHNRRWYVFSWKEKEIRRCGATDFKTKNREKNGGPVWMVGFPKEKYRNQDFAISCTVHAFETQY